MDEFVEDDAREPQDGGQLAVRAQGVDDDGPDELAVSYAAFKESLSRGRELHKLKKELAAHGKALRQMRAEYDDNVDILENFDAVVGAQADIIEGNEKIIASSIESVERMRERISELERQRADLESRHARELGPESDELYRRGQELANASTVARACKDDAKALRKAASGEGEVSEARLARAAEDLELAEQRLEAARARQREAQRAYDSKAKAFKREEDALSDEASRLGKEAKALEKEAGKLREKADTARARIEHCRAVAADPGATEDLARQIEEAVEDEREMRAELDGLSQEHARAKHDGRVARRLAIAFGAVIVLTVLIIVFGRFLS